LADWLARQSWGWLGLLIGWLAGWLASWLAGWLAVAGWPAGWLTEWLAGSLIWGVRTGSKRCQAGSDQKVMDL